ncbi:hypothetical protein [Brevibacillus porteri]|uniref:hypothetical protein n=1 Tax=Brevibacillus porteri TaxID=2126350 RepID=UPI003634621D
MHRYNVYFDYGDYEVSTIVKAKEEQEAIQLAKEKLEGKGFDLTDTTPHADYLETISK